MPMSLSRALVSMPKGQKWKFREHLDSDHQLYRRSLGINHPTSEIEQQQAQHHALKPPIMTKPY